MQGVNSWKAGAVINHSGASVGLRKQIKQILRNVLTMAEQGTAFTASSHSGLAEYHRAHLIIDRVRIAIVGLSLVLFVAAATDFVIFPTAAATVLLRGFLLGGIAFTILAIKCRCKPSTGHARIAVGLLFAISTAIFLFSSHILVRGHLISTAFATPGRCFFAPLVLLALITFFPLTFLELLLLTLPLLLIFVIANFSSMAPINPAVSDSLLLAVLLVIGLIASAGSLGQTCLMRALLRRSLRDPLTKALNRRSGELVLQLQLAQAKYDGSPISVAFVDIDNFKQINDQLGHQAGDMILRGVADRLRIQLRECDALIRWSGDEFLVVMPGARAKDAAKRLGFLIGGPSLPKIKGKPVTWSYGIAEWPHNAEDGSWQALVMAADTQMYEAKRQDASDRCEINEKRKNTEAAVN